jgi:predicted adenylyl cyclase CyaB
MSQNVELKFKVADRQQLERALHGLVGQPAGVFHQEDIFFAVPFGYRFKLRQSTEGKAELIIYSRADVPSIRNSKYIRVPLWNSNLVRAVLGMILRERGNVCKHRTLYLKGSTRIHVDEVDGLGTYGEIEVVIGSNCNQHDANHIASKLVRKLSISKSSIVNLAYIDLLTTTRSG